MYKRILSGDNPSDNVSVYMRVDGPSSIKISYVTTSSDIMTASCAV